MPRTLISLGANLGNPMESIRAASQMLSDEFGPANVLFSRQYRTPPIGGPSGQSDFINAVAAIETEKSVWEVWESVKQIEKSLGRQRQHRWEARRIDIDLLLFDQLRIWTPHLKIPHPRMCMRTFVLEPAREIVPDWIDPVSQWSIDKLGGHLRNANQNGLPIRLLCESQTAMDRLRSEFERNLPGDLPAIVWDLAQPESNDSIRASVDSTRPNVDSYKLSIAAVSSPDPTTILWEDYSMQWARWLELVPNENAPQAERRFSGPRYLLPADDSKWAVHEIIAAYQAMKCSMVPVL